MRTRGTLSLIILVALLGLTLVQPVEMGKAATSTFLPPVTEADGRMGTCYSFYDTMRIQQAYEAGSRWDRFDFRWNAIAEYGYGPHEALINRYAAMGWPLHVVGILGAAPDALSTCNTAPVVRRAVGDRVAPVSISAAWWNACPPINLDRPWNAPDNYWGQFVYQTVLHFKGQVDVWEVWNEPDLTLFWQGTPEQYAQLLKVAYQAIKAANPDATVLFGGLAYWSNPDFYKAVLDAIAADPESVTHNGYFDVMSLHLYSNVETPYEVSRSVMAEVAARVGPHPLWLTEAGVPVWDDGGPVPSYSATMEEAASYVIEAYAEARVAGVDKFFFFRLHDEAMSERFGLTRNDYSLRPAYFAYQVAARYLRGENQITGPFGTSVRRITFWGTPHGRVDLLWNRTESPLTYALPAVLPQATLVDRYGATQSLSPEGGYYRLDLAPVTNPLIGGPPVLVIQEDTVPPRTTELTALLGADGLHLSWSVSDDAAGYWYEEIERADAPDGPWVKIADWAATRDRQRLVLTAPDGAESWYLRARARDRTGNYESWTEAPRTQVTLAPRRTVTVSVTVRTETGAAIPATIRWLDPQNRVLAEGVASSWQATEELFVPATYRLIVKAEGYLPMRFDFTPQVGLTPIVYTFEAQLVPIVGRAYLPFVIRMRP